MTAHALCAKETQTHTRMGEIRIDQIDATQLRIRAVEEDEAFAALRESIGEHGLIEPIAVRETAQGYALVTGAMRLEACKQLGWSRVPAQIFAQCDACEAWLMSLSENLHRRSLHYFEEAQGYRRAIEEFSLTQEALSRRIGRSQSTIANKMRLLQLREHEQQAIRRAGMSERHARTLLLLEDEEARMRLIQLCAGQEITVRQLEALVAQELAKKEASAEGGTERRVLLIMHDQRLYINAIRDIVSQMKASGIRADMKLEDLGDRIEMRVTLPRRGGSARKD